LLRHSPAAQSGEGRPLRSNQQQREAPQRWWSLLPVTSQSVPDVRNRDWSASPVDRFVAARLEAADLATAPRADRTVLIRRLSFVLTGLPPTPQQVAEFVGDPDPHAYVRLVDRLLASPHFGERWARHWMDVVRYGDTYGYEWDIPAKEAWRYRDYLVRAVNQNVPFDQLVREQIAGDLLADPRVDAINQINESRIGPMFFQFGEKRHGDSADFNGVHQEMLDGMIDSFSKTFQATTVACARCHDHKFDAVSQRDYYALAGVFMSSRWVTNTLDTPDRNRDALEQLRKLKPPIRAAMAAAWLHDARHFAEYLRDGESRLADRRRVMARAIECAWPNALGWAPAAATLAGWTAHHDEMARPANLDTARLEAWMKALMFKTDPAVEDLLHPWAQLTRAARNGLSVEAQWKTLRDQYDKIGRERAERNGKEYQVVADFRQGVPPGWSVDGVGLRDGPVRCGDFSVAVDGVTAIDRVLPDGLVTSELSPRLNGVVRSPYLKDIERNHISIERFGGDFSVQRTVVDNAFLTERNAYIAHIGPTWATFSTFPDKRDRRIYVELATKTSNPNFPPRYHMQQCTDEQARDPRSWFGVTRVVAHDTPEPPKDELVRFRSFFAGEPPADLAAAAQRYALWFTQAIEAWQRDAASADDVLLINWMLERRLLTNSLEAVANVSSDRNLIGAYRAIEKTVATPQTINGMADVDPGHDYRINVRGVLDDFGPAVPRGYVQSLTGTDAGFGVNHSGRLELAHCVADPSNPLTARVIVNRVWHWVFGRGLVATPDDFGKLGDAPSHPELLDFLAGQFVNDGWSIKKLVRQLVLTETFQQSGQASDRGRELDAQNRLLHHFAPRRLEAEAIRDSILAISGRLDRQLTGPTVDPPRTKEDIYKRLVSGPLDGNGRRSIYTKVTLMEPAKLLATFNQPDPKITTGRRDVTNVPAQALALLNDPFVVAQAEYWARNLVATPPSTTPTRITAMFQTAFGRDPTPAELAEWRLTADELAQLHNVTKDAIIHSVAVWKDLAHAMFNMKEFIYVR
jgi:hypothetical protein